MIGKGFYLKRLFYLLTLCFFSACSDIADENDIFDTSNIKLQTRLATESTVDNENKVNDLSLIFFNDGKFINKLDNVIIKENGNVEVPVKDKVDCVYFISEFGRVFGNETISSEDSFVNKLGIIYSEGNTPVFMTAKKDFSLKEEVVKLSRGVARIDVVLLEENLEIKKIEIPSVYTTGYLFKEHKNVNVPEEHLQKITKDFSTSPIKETTEGVLYLYEQKHDKEIPFEVTFVKDGKEKTVESKFPSVLQRNKKYSIILLSSNSNVSLKVEETPWGVGEDTGLYPDINNKILIDRKRTELSHGAYISETNDTLYLPYWDSNVNLAFVSEHDLECHPDDNSEITVNVIAREPGNGFQVEDKFLLKSKLRAINSDKKYVHLGMRVRGKLNDVNQIVVALQDHQIKFSHDKDFKDAFAFTNATYDFGKYVDGTIGYLQLPEDHKVINPSEKGRWIRIDSEQNPKIDEKNIYLVEGGYKPNDETADGRTQEAEIIIERPTAVKGEMVQEKYVFKRENWGLPVVEINGHYWAKYNLRGNVKKFTNQVLWDEDKELNSLEGNSLMNYLKTRVEWETISIPGWGDWKTPYFRQDDTTERIYKLMGHGYLSNRTDGMSIKAENAESENYFYEGYKEYPNNEDTGMFPATEMAPDGYKLPTPEEFSSLLPESLIYLGKNSENPATKEYMLNGKKVTLEAYPMDYTKNMEGVGFEGFTDIEVGGRYGYIPMVFITVDGNKEPLILMGHKPQIRNKKDNDNPTKADCVVFACEGGGKNIFALNAINQDFKIGIQDVGTMTGAGDNMGKVVKMIRCIKTPVKYIME